MCSVAIFTDVEFSTYRLFFLVFIQGKRMSLLLGFLFSFKFVSSERSARYAPPQRPLLLVILLRSYSQPKCFSNRRNPANTSSAFHHHETLLWITVGASTPRDVNCPGQHSTTLPSHHSKSTNNSSKYNVVTAQFARVNACPRPRRQKFRASLLERRQLKVEMAGA